MGSIGWTDARVLYRRFLSQSQMREATVLAVGPGRRTSTGELVPLDVETGDVVALPEFGGVSVELGDESAGKEYAVYREEEILAVVTKN